MKTAILILLAGAMLPAGAPQGEEGVLRLGPVTLLHPPERHGSAVAFMNVLPDVLAAVRSFTGAELRRPIRIELVPDHQALLERVADLGGWEPDPWIEGLAYPRRRLILIRLDARGSRRHRVEGLLTHELTHIALGEFAAAEGAAEIPRWFDEGVAQLAEGRPLTQLFWDLPMRARFGLLIPLESLDEAFREPGGRRALAYVQAESFLRHLTRRRGSRRLVRAVLADVAAGMPLEASIQRHTWMSLRQHEMTWENALTGDVAGSLRAMAPLIFGIFVGVSALVILWRMARRRRMIEEAWDREEAWSGGAGENEAEAP